MPLREANTYRVESLEPRILLAADLAPIDSGPGGVVSSAESVLEIPHNQDTVEPEPADLGSGAEANDLFAGIVAEPLISPDQPAPAQPKVQPVAGPNRAASIGLLSVAPTFLLDSVPIAAG